MLTITNQSTTIKFLLDNGAEYNVDKDNISIKKKGRYVYVYHGDKNETTKKLKFRYSEVSSPVLRIMMNW